MSSKPAGYSGSSRRSPAIEKAAGIRRLFPEFRFQRSRPGLEPLAVAMAAMVPARPAIPVVATIPVEPGPDRRRRDRVRIDAASLRRRNGHPGASAWRGGASGRRRGSCRADRPHPRSSSARPPWSPWCRRARAAAPPDPPAAGHPSAHPAWHSSAHWRDRSAAWRNPAPRTRPAATVFPDRASASSPAFTAAIRASAKAARSSGLIPHMAVKPRPVLGIDHGRTGDGKRRHAGEKQLLHANLL